MRAVNARKADGEIFILKSKLVVVGLAEMEEARRGGKRTFLLAKDEKTIYNKKIVSVSRSSTTASMISISMVS